MNLDRTPQTPPLIKKMPEGVSQPLWSVMIPTYNCIRYLEETLKSVLQQALPEDAMQIEVIDDCSSDGDVEALVYTVGRGRIHYHRKEENSGSLRNFETCINRAKGQLVHILHGDDVVRPGFYTTIERVFNEYPQAGACYSSYDYIDEKGQNVWPIQQLQEGEGIIEDWLEKIARNNLVQPPAMVVKRGVYEHLGSFFAVHYGEDWEMWARIAAHYPVAFSPQHLASYRVHTTNITTRSILTGQNVKDIQKVIRIISDYLPYEKRKTLTAIATRNFALYFAALSDKIYHEHRNRKAAVVQAFMSARMYPTPATLRQVAKILVKCAINYQR